ncbi:LOW QUALITY PROTEIN: sine oculis-binding protein homolog [Aplochiton taeniatus]
MPEMEKGRPPENKRSRKPAHPVKREINQEMKTFAESTMNELLGWYGYDKVELRDSEASEIRNYRERRQHVSVLKGRGQYLYPKEHKSAPVIVPLINHLQSTVEDVQNVQIVCVWCQKEGVKRYSLCMGSEPKSFCSEKCFAACRRAYFKRNKARDEDLHGERSPQRPHTDDSPRLVLKMNSTARVCDWCKHIRHTKEYLDFGAGEERLQFCSTKCLNQYKMDVFYREARAALTNSSPSPGRPSQEGRAEGSGGAQNLLTPESWSSNSSGGDLRQRNRLPKEPTPIHGSAASTSVSPSEASSSSSKVAVSGLRSLERPLHPLNSPLPARSTSPYTLPPPPPHRPHTEHHPMPPLPMPFIRPPLHAQGLRSPLANGPRHPGPPSSPIYRPPHSPHLQPPSASSMNPQGLVHPYPGAYFPGLHSPPINIMPRGPIPMPPMMNFGYPSFAPFLPQPTVLVPYPIIVPIPVPIPIPIPIPIPSKAAPEPPVHSGVIQPVPEGVDRSMSRGPIQSSPAGSVGDSRQVADRGGRTSSDMGLPLPSDPTRRNIDWVKSETQLPSPTSCPQNGASSPGARCNGSPSSDGLSDCMSGQQQPERQVIQRLLPRNQVKLEPNPHGVVNLSGPAESGTGVQATRVGHHDEPACPPSPQSPSHDNAPLQSTHTPPPHTPPSTGECSPASDVTTSALFPPERGQSGHDSSSPPPPYSDSQPPRAAPPPDLSELEAVKENSCSVVGPARAEGPVGQSELPVAVGGEEGEDPHVPDEDHAYALPTAPRTAGTPTPLLLPKLRDKGVLRSAPSVAGPGDLEPALKRRCLRIRDQNK